MEEKTASMLMLQKELDELREDHTREKELAARRAREDEEELQILRERCERLEGSGGGGGVSCPCVSYAAANSCHCYRPTQKFSISFDRTWKVS